MPSMTVRTPHTAGAVARAPPAGADGDGEGDPPEGAVAEGFALAEPPLVPEGAAELLELFPC